MMKMIFQLARDRLLQTVTIEVRNIVNDKHDWCDVRRMMTSTHGAVPLAEPIPKDATLPSHIV